MVNAYSQREIAAKARAMADLLLQATFEPDFLEPAWEAYCRVREALASGGLRAPADVPNDQSIKRLFFEVIAFAAFIVMGQEVPKWLTRKSPLGEVEPDVESILDYNTQFLNRIAHHLEAPEFARLREVTPISIQPAIRFADGEPLSIVRRVAGYFQAGSVVESARDFSRFAALAMDAEHSVLLQPITLRLVESVVRVSRILLKGVFAHQLAPDSSG
jgi:hypothetical protein